MQNLGGGTTVGIKKLHSVGENNTSSMKKVVSLIVHVFTLVLRLDVNMQPRAIRLSAPVKIPVLQTMVYCISSLSPGSSDEIA